MPRFGKLVEGERGPGDSAWMASSPVPADGSSTMSPGAILAHGHEKAEAERRRELLELVAFLGTARVGRQQGGKPLQQDEMPPATARLLQHPAPFRRNKWPRFGGFVGVFPEPGAVLSNCPNAAVIASRKRRASRGAPRSSEGNR